MRNGMTVLLVGAALALSSSDAGIAAAAAANRQYTSGKFALELDGNHAGFLFAVDGGLAFGDVVKEAGEDFFFKKQLGNRGYRDIRLEVGVNMEKSFYNWIALVLQGQRVRLSGAILAADNNNNVVSRLEFQRAQITEVTFPALDGASKDVARMSIVLTPEQTVLNRGAFGKVSGKSSATQKNWLSSNFKISIDGLDTTRVAKIEAMTIKFPRISFGDDTACLRCPESSPAAPTRVDFPNVVMTLSEVSAGPVQDWFDDFVVSGNNDDSQEKGGTLEFLAANMQTTLFTIKLKNLGIFEMMPIVDPAEKISRVVAAMYCESMEFLAQ